MFFEFNGRMMDVLIRSVLEKESAFRMIFSDSLLHSIKDFVLFHFHRPMQVVDSYLHVIKN